MPAGPRQEAGQRAHPQQQSDPHFSRMLARLMSTVVRTLCFAACRLSGKAAMGGSRSRAFMGSCFRAANAAIGATQERRRRGGATRAERRGARAARS